MKLVIGTMFALLLAGGSAYAQEPDKDKPKDEPQKHEEARKGEQRGKQDEPKTKPRQEPARHPEEHAKPAQQNDRAQQQQQEERNRNQQRTTQQERSQEQQRSQEQRSQDQQRAQQTAQHRDNDRGNNGGHGRRVPEQQFRTSFGREHHFRVQRNEDRRFNYGGYYFTYNDTWPSDWDYNDDVYVDEIDGEYYLINPRHPGMRLMVVVAD